VFAVEMTAFAAAEMPIRYGAKGEWLYAVGSFSKDEERVNGGAGEPRQRVA
jgi:hypothetical protein